MKNELREISIFVRLDGKDLTCDSIAVPEDLMPYKRLIAELFEDIGEDFLTEDIDRVTVN